MDRIPAARVNSGILPRAVVFLTVDPPSLPLHLRKSFALYRVCLKRLLSSVARLALQLPGTGTHKNRAVFLTTLPPQTLPLPSAIMGGTGTRPLSAVSLEVGLLPTLPSSTSPPKLPVINTVRAVSLLTSRSLPKRSLPKTSPPNTCLPSLSLPSPSPPSPSPPNLSLPNPSLLVTRMAAATATKNVVLLPFAPVPWRPVPLLV